MALIKQKISIPFANGINTKVDDKQLPIGYFKKLENVRLDTPFKLKKRTGYNSISFKTTTNGSIIDPVKLSKLNEELLLFSDTNFYAYIDSIEKWSDKGTVKTATIETQKVINNNKQQTNLDIISVDGLNMIVYQDSDGIHLTIKDNANDSYVLKSETISATGIKPKIVSRYNEVYIFFIDSTTLKYRKFAAYDFHNIESETTVTTSLNATNQNYDVETISDRVVVGFNSSTASGTLAFISILSDDTLTSIIEVAGETPTNGISIDQDSSNRMICSYADATDAKIVIYNYTFAVKILAETSLETIANISNITAVETSSENYTVVYEISAASSRNHYIKKQTITLAGSLGTATVLKRSIGLASKIFSTSDNNYFLTIHDSTLQSTYYILDVSGVIYGKLNQYTAGDVITTGSLPSVASISSNEFLSTQQIKGRLVEDNGTFFSLLGVNTATINLDTSNKYQDVEFKNTLHIAGGIMKMYDGSSVVEHGFLIYPEDLVDGGTATTGGSISDGTYEYIAVYAWADSNGITHRSATSVSKQITLSGGTTTQTQTITIPTLRLTEKEDVIVELYRTEDSGTVFYMVSDSQNPTFNDPTVDTINITDTTSDSDLINNEVLYNTGGVLENFPARRSSIIETFKNRVFTTTIKSDKLAYSKLVLEGYPVEFNESLELVIPKTGGDNVALVTMDDKLIIFKERSILYIMGDGPNNLGEQDTFIEPELIINSIGCINANSVILTPTGVMFKSRKGIYLLDRGLSLQYIGAEVEDYNDLTITSAKTVDAKNQTIFTTSNGDSLVFDYVMRKWSTFTNHKATSAEVLEGEYYYLRPDNLVYKESNNFDDNGTSIKMKLESGWMSFAGVQDFQRVYKMLLLGHFKSSHKLRIKVAYDFVDAWVQEKIIDTSDFTSNTAYGDSSPYGAESTYGAENSYQIRLDFKRQKCESIKISIEDLQPTAGEGLELSNMLFVVGRKASEFKVDKSNSYGTN